MRGGGGPSSRRAVGGSAAHGSGVGGPGGVSAASHGRCAWRAGRVTCDRAVRLPTSCVLVGFRPVSAKVAVFSREPSLRCSSETPLCFGGVWSPRRSFSANTNSSKTLILCESRSMRKSRPLNAPPARRNPFPIPSKTPATQELQNTTSNFVARYSPRRRPSRYRKRATKSVLSSLARLSPPRKNERRL